MRPAGENIRRGAYEMQLPGGEHFRFHTSSRSTGKFGFTWTLAPGKSGPAEHNHPHETETFRIVSGTIRVWLDGMRSDLSPGDVLAIPPGQPHRFLNAGAVPVVIEVTADGPRLEDQFIPLAIAAEGQKLSLGLLLQSIPHIMHAIESGSTRPTSRVETRIMSALAGVVRLFGYRPLPSVERWD